MQLQRLGHQTFLRTVHFTMQDIQVGDMLVELLHPKISEPNNQCNNIIV